MNLQVLYCNHQSADLDVRSRLAFAPGDLPRAYETLRSRFPHSEVVLLSTCNRVELYTAQQQAERLPSHQALSEFLAEFHQLSIERFAGTLFERTGPDAVRHLFQVAASLDSMVLGEPQIVAQVKEAYTFAQQQASTGPLTHSLFQRALGVSKRIRTETNLVNGRTSIASVAVGDFGKNIFQSFDDKTVLVIGAGEMAEETLRYLKDEGARRIVVVNRTLERAETLARDWGGEARSLEALDDALVDADVIVATTGVRLVDTAKFREVRRRSGTKPVFILDLGVPRDFPPEVRDLDDNVFLYTIDDLQAVCDENRRTRQRDVEAALKIVDEETDRFFAELNHRATGPIIRRLRDQWREVVEQETARLFQKLPHLEKDRKEIEKTIEQMVNKLLHPPLEALRDESREGTPHGLLDALRRLFRL
jgi:glutamyl-tRNA reductase